MEEKTLAQFVQQKREKLGLSTGGLSRKCNVKLETLERIEAGEDLFLPVTVRQNLAKGLKCDPKELKHLEKSFDNHFVDAAVVEDLKQMILNGEKDLLCPKCNSPLVTRIEKMYDLEDNLMLHPKAKCSKCVFQIKD